MTLADGGHRYFLTWGRVLRAAAPVAVEALVLRSALGLDLGAAPVAARVCPAVRMARDARFFYEAMFDMARTASPYGKKYGKWRKDKAALMEQGKEIWYLGFDPAGTASAE